LLTATEEADFDCQAEAVPINAPMKHNECPKVFLNVLYWTEHLAGNRKFPGSDEIMLRT
jgi:hypothetical protein